MKRIWPIFLLLIMMTLLIATPVLAIALPDSTPTIEDIDCYRNVLESGDFLCIVYENTPYTSTPNMTHSEAFIWSLRDGSTILAQASCYDYQSNGHGYNVASFYLNAANFTAFGMAWGNSYTLRLSGTPSAFAAPPIYNYTVTSADYSNLTDQDDIQVAIAARIVSTANDLNNKWGLATDEYLTTESEVGTVLSIYGQTFFRGAIYGVQSMAPDAFPFVVTSITATDRTWAPTYVDTLVNQYTGTYIEDALQAGQDFFNVSYNLMGIMIIAAAAIALLIANWVLVGGNLWKGALEIVPPFIIGGRLALFGLGELGLIAAIGWLYISAKVWKIV